MERLKPYLPYIVIAVLLFILFFGGNKDDYKADELKKEDKSNQKLIDEIVKINEQLFIRRDSASKEIGSTKTIINNNEKTKEVRIEYIKNLTDDEYQKYFDEYE